jgi:transposase
VDIIANCLGCHWSTIFRLLNTAKNLPPRQILERKKGSGRPKKIPGHALKVLEQFFKKNSCATAGEIKQQVPEVSGISVRHINWLILKKLKMPSRIVAQKPLLTEKMKKKMLAFAKKNP